ncbi:MAG: hypothetical protein ACRDHZ_00020 [Ktedonobacteraceae bacterium]
MGFNPFKGRQKDGGAGKAPEFGYNWEEAIAALGKTPDMSDRAFADAMGAHSWSNQICDDVRKVHRYRNAARQEISKRAHAQQVKEEQKEAHEERIADGTVSVPRQPAQNNKPGFFAQMFSGRKQAQTATQAPPQEKEAASGVKEVQHGNMTLISFSPEELLHQVEDRRNSVSFDLSGTAKFMENFNQLWSWVGPLLFAAGTIGEIFLVLWSRQTEQSYFAAFSIIAVSMIAEGTLLAISFSAKRLRNRADKRASGWSDKERHKLNVLKRFWFLLMLCVAATQIAFVIAQTKPDGIGLVGLWVIAIVRAFSAGVADAYTAFVSEEKPTTGDKALDQTEQEGLFTSKLLTQKAKEVELLNAGAIRVQEVGMEASERQKRQAAEARMREDRLNTEMEMDRLLNIAKIENIKQEHQQKILIDRMRNSSMQAIFDPDMDPQKRIQIITMLTNLMGTMRELPPGHIDSIDEEGGL